MNTCAASRLVTGPFDEVVIRDTARELRERLSGRPTFALAFITPDYAEQAGEFLELIRVYGQVPMVIGCSGNGLIGTAVEREEGPGFSLMMVSLPGGKATAYTLTQDDVEICSGPEFWREKTGVAPGQAKAWLTFINPFALNMETWLKQWSLAYPGVPIFGSVAGAVPGDSEAWVLRDDGPVAGGVVLALEGDIAVEAVVSQGCKPIGEPLTVTQAQHNILLTLGSRPAYEVLSDVYKELSDAEREQARGHLFAGLAVSEYLDDYKLGDFLVRNIIGADPKSRAVQINAVPRVGQTLQYQLRDSHVASEELRRLLSERARVMTAPPFAGLLCSCHGRGVGLFGRANHDAGLVNNFFPDLPVAGVFSHGQIGPVGGRSYSHGYTASLALIGPAAPVAEE